ncbi:dihydroneopterin aldolase [Tropicimonas sp. S265A]|uniref:dihydroneopterin aldolase n=1 Tax=Tropicimonas sp. S265A TaxID=3415134 RepID=UPI003C7AD0D4
MSSEILLAFAHPEKRAAAMSERDRISLRDHVREVEIGAYQAERGTTQSIRFNIVVEVRTAAETLADDVDKVLSYDTIADAIDAALAEERLNLLETLAERIAERILADPRAARAFIRIEKLDRGPYALGVEIVREAEAIRLAPLEPEPRPRLVFLHESALHDHKLSEYLDAWEALDEPLILCVGPVPRPSPHSAVRGAQRRIDLLSIEQNAWVLAGRDPRCVVVATRAEIDWALRQGQTTVWAPSKLVLDAADGPTPAPEHPRALMRWLGERLDAIELLEWDDAGVRPLPSA